jgi:hypothetical protein
MEKKQAINNHKLNIFHMDMNYVCLKPEFLRGWLRRVASLGFNAILWEIEDKVQWETCPQCVWPEAMTKCEFKDLLAYSRSLGLEPIPLLQTIGHAEYVLIHPDYHAFREVSEYHDCYCTSNPDVTTFLRRWIEEYLELFGEIRYFHLGGDEAYRFGQCPKCSAIAQTAGKVKLYSDHINAVGEPLLKKGIRPGIWNDMVIRHPESINQISRQFIIWDWNYWDTDTTPEKVRIWGKGTLAKDEIDTELAGTYPEIFSSTGELQSFYTVRTEKKHGFDIILCSSSRAEADNVYCPRLMHAGNIVGAAATVAKEDLLGNCVTSWAVRMNDLITQAPSIALAERALSHPDKSANDLLVEYCREFFGAEPAGFIQAMGILGVSLPFAMASTTGIYWNGLKDNLPIPPGYLKSHLKLLEEKDPKWLATYPGIIEEACTSIPRAIALLAKFFSEAHGGLDVVEHWLTAAHFLLQRALIARQVILNQVFPETVEVLNKQKQEYSAFLCRCQTAESAKKNADRVFDALIDYCRDIASV